MRLRVSNRQALVAPTELTRALAQDGAAEDAWAAFTTRRASPARARRVAALFTASTGRAPRARPGSWLSRRGFKGRRGHDRLGA